MTAISACPVLSETSAITVAAELAADFASGAAGRDRDRELPFAEIDRLSASGLLAITVPAAYGGAGLPASAVAEVVRILATGDPNIAQIPHSHFVYINLLRLAGSDDQLRHHAALILRGARIANAQSERSSATVADIATTVRPDGGRFRIDGAKYYCTGSLFADTLAVLTRLDDPDGDSGLADGHYVAFLPADTPGVRIVDDWQALGQRTTASGTVIFDGVVVEQSALVPRAPAVSVPTGYGAFAQLLHAAIDTGIARGALAAAASFVRDKSRPWFEAGVAHAADDPLLIQRFGELAVAVQAAEAALAVAGAKVDDAPPAEASLAVAGAKILADNAANEVSGALFEVGGTRSAAAELNLDHFWRNARTHTLHDPVRWKYQHLGRAVLHGTPPPLHSAI
ncbi:SfnB family sulfur acquisition oxidoreductase [Mycolicibacterium aichiense]|uniref:Dibenzothiophene monooxygenase n=1 Tax=Mycolicibacterium aichiense TaxID=1799 RepID=A0AAD1HNI7_9MYCO|nr:SfnB family sulfur acquisition oxidoreductase [Mycolicibacterium aichiense]MCV7018783.1 SfnB family sulfur acquisition oxidoreductase [Mycolicibacterium aichiense]BBX08677.1 SfnB family sulfur acquisition oxidoreductase [Mycolicibacterium aichiense]STZ82472.1 acyl-CoA dehydrogenase [Mycolicibacterium aichiense]